MPTMSLMTRLSALGLALLLSACASVKIPAPTAAADNVSQLRDAKLAPASAGNFTPAASLPAGTDASMGGLRSNSVAAESGSWSRYLRDQLVADLSAAGLYDDKAPIRIEAQLTESLLDAAIGTGTGSLAARFRVERAGKTVYEKTLRVNESWESSFVGAVALPMAINKYTSFYKSLLAKLYQDPEFRAALAR